VAVVKGEGMGRSQRGGCPRGHGDPASRVENAQRGQSSQVLCPVWSKQLLLGSEQRVT
jgi:hypothetical protein